jgi:Asp-tRNA(Asn)/Glu-tRNA(Gln) amidotransferase A subunit family amidase
MIDLSESASSLLARLGSGEFSASELVDASLARIDSDEVRLNAFITVDRARARASALESSSRLPLSGLPFSVKDTIEVAGLAATAGSLILREHRPTRTATLVQRIMDAGAIMVGKTNCSEFGIGNLEAWSPIAGQTHNPWAAERTPGGSSGGDSAAVAAGMVSFGIGTDFGGSLRFPAHCTGIAALRPTPGRLPVDGQLPQFAELPPPTRPSYLQRDMQTPGFLARAISDLKLLLEVGSGKALDAPRVGRAAWFVDDVSPDVLLAVRAAVDALIDSDVPADAIDDPGSATAASLLAELRDSEGLPEIAWFAAGREELLSPLVARLLVRPLRPLRTDIHSRINQIRERFAWHFDRVDVVLMPVATEPAFLIEPGSQPDRSTLDRPTRMVTLLGLPAVVVRCGTSGDGLPIGVQIVAREDRDEDALYAASLIESALGGSLPPLPESSSNPLDGSPQ